MSWFWFQFLYPLNQEWNERTLIMLDYLTVAIEIHLHAVTLGFVVLCQLLSGGWKLYLIEVRGLVVRVLYNALQPLRSWNTATTIVDWLVVIGVLRSSRKLLVYYFYILTSIENVFSWADCTSLLEHFNAWREIHRLFTWDRVRQWVTMIIASRLYSVAKPIFGGPS